LFLASCPDFGGLVAWWGWCLPQLPWLLITLSMSSSMVVSSSLGLSPCPSLAFMMTGPSSEASRMGITTGMLACSADLSLIFLDCVYGLLPWRCPLGPWWMSPIFFGWSCLQILGHHRDPQLPIIVIRVHVVRIQSRPLHWPVPLFPTCWPAANLAHASSLIKEPHMCDCQSHPCSTLVRVQSHQVLCQLINQAVYSCFLRMQAWEYFIFLAAQVNLVCLGVCLLIS